MNGRKDVTEQLYNEVNWFMKICESYLMNFIIDVQSVWTSDLNPTCINRKPDIDWFSSCHNQFVKLEPSGKCVKWIVSIMSCDFKLN
jgi:hypothetical protein